MDVHGCIMFARGMIFSAISSFAKGKARFGDETGVRRWLLTDDYQTMCYWAEWDPDWIISIFTALKKADAEVRPDLARQCIALLSKRAIES